MKTLTGLFILVFMALTALGQTEPERKLNFYFNTFLSEEFDFGNQSYHATLNSHSFSVGYQWNRSVKLINEIEIMPFRFGQSEYAVFYNDTLEETDLFSDGYKYQVYNSSLRLSFIYLSGSPKLKFMIGSSCSVFYLNQRILPLSSGNFFQSETRLGVALEFLPGLQYMISENIFIRLDVPFSMLDIGFRRARVENPAYEKKQRISDVIGAYFLEQKFLFRLGLSCKI